MSRPTPGLSAVERLAPLRILRILVSRRRATVRDWPPIVTFVLRTALQRPTPLEVVAYGASLAAGLVSGLRLEHALVRRRGRPAEAAFEPLPGREYAVITTDGISLHVEEAGDPDAALTLVYVHGFTVTQECWWFQRRDLSDLGRAVFYDQRSHGRSGRADASSCTIQQLGEDLHSVLDQRAPTGRVVLVGHSMGGMTIMALAEQHPELFGERVIGVALLATSSGELATVTMGLPALASKALLHLVPLAPQAGRRSQLIEQRRREDTDIGYVLTDRIAYGQHSSPALVGLMQRMFAQCSIEAFTAFLPTFYDHNRREALAGLSAVPVLVLVGDNDLLTPYEHNRAIADELPHSTFALVPGAGHMVILEEPGRVNVAVRSLVRRALAAARSHS